MGCFSTRARAQRGDMKFEGENRAIRDHQKMERLCRSLNKTRKPNASFATLERWNMPSTRFGKRRTRMGNRERQSYFTSARLAHFHQIQQVYPQLWRKSYRFPAVGRAAGWFCRNQPTGGEGRN